MSTASFPGLSALVFRTARPRAVAHVENTTTGGSSFNRRYFAKAVAVVLLIVGARATAVNLYTVNVPKNDSLKEAETLLIPWLDGTLTLSHLTTTYNEHRFVTQRVATLALFVLTGQWDERTLITFNVLQAGLVAALFLWMVPKLLGYHRQNIVLILIGVLYCVPVCWEDQLWSYQGMYYGYMVLLLVALWGLLTKPSYSAAWWAGAVCSFVSIYTLASGFVVGPAVTAVTGWQLLHDREQWRRYLPSLIVGLFVSVFGYWVLPVAEEFHAKSLNEFLVACGRIFGWPSSKYHSAAILLYLPSVLLFVSVVRRRSQLNQAEAFVMGFSIWIWLQALGMAYARGTMVFLTDRYIDVWMYGPIANFLALLLLADRRREAGWGRARWFQVLAAAWAVTFAAGFIHSSSGLRARLAEHHHWENERLHNFRQFMADDTAHFPQGAYIACPYTDWVEKVMRLPRMQPFMPPELQRPALLQPADGSRSAFVTNGLPESTPKYFGQDVVGSFNEDGPEATGTFRSDVIEPNYAYLHVPVAGQPFAPGMSVKLVVESTGEEKPLQFHAQPGGAWSLAKTKAPAGPFRIVVEDQNRESWVAVGAPRQQAWLCAVSEAFLKFSWKLTCFAAVLYCVVAGWALSLLREMVGFVPLPATGASVGA